MTRRQFFVLGVLAALSLAGYVVVGKASGQTGFPLDDAWIHQAYARTLAAHGQWGLAAGQPSAGATSLLWVLLLAPGVVLGLAPFIWTGLLGWLSLWGLACLTVAVVRELAPAHAAAAIGAGVFVLFEFHLVWASASGMETALFAAICLATMLALLRARNARQWLGAGLLVGAAVLVRPDGLTLLGPLAIGLWQNARPRKSGAVSALLGLSLALVPYLLFNQATAGQWWPNTLYAKQAEYAALLQQPLLARLGQQWAQPLIGAGLILLPGLWLAVRKAWLQKDWVVLAWAAWIFGFLALYAIRLPVVYQHGRYAMPVLPIYIALGFAGLLGWLQPAARLAWRRQLSLAWLAAAAFASAGFYALGAQAFARDVAFINTQMVAAADWIDGHTPPTARVAAHDIGALGYIASRPLIDLAGLVSPQVIPFIRDEAQLAAYLDASGAEYLVAFPDWYPQLSRRGELLFQTQGFDGAAGLTVYRWK